MGSTTKISLEEFQSLQETSSELEIYELDEGEVAVAPSQTPRESIVRYRLQRALTDFVQSQRLGLVLGGTEFLLTSDTVRRPDVAFIVEAQVKEVDFHRSPVTVAPRLAVEVISPGNRAQDTLKKTRQYLAAGGEAVWLVYPELRILRIHDALGIRDLTESEPIREERLFPGHTFHLSLTALFDDDPER